MCLVGCEGVVGVGVECSVKVCIKGCCGVSVSVGVFKILYQDQGVCQGYLSVSCQGMSKVYIGVSGIYLRVMMWACQRVSASCWGMSGGV